MKKAPTIEELREQFKQGKEEEALIDFACSLDAHLDNGPNEWAYDALLNIHKACATTQEYKVALASIFIASLNNNLARAIEFCIENIPPVFKQHSGLSPLVFAAHKDDKSKLFFQLLKSYVSKKVAIEIEKLTDPTDGECSRG